MSAHSAALDFVANFNCRRTGITLPQQRLDEHGLEEVSNLFSSPRKPSPLKNVINADGLTPPQALSTRRPLRASLLRSASPRKTGISGIARRSNGIDIRAISREPEIPNSDDREVENAVPSSPTRANHSVRRYSEAIEKTPLRDITTKNTLNSRDKSTWDKLIAEEAGIAASVEDEFTPPHEATQEEVENVQYQDAVEDNHGPIIGDDNDYAPQIRDFTPTEEPPPPQFDDEEADTTFEPQLAFFPKAKANSRRKRKSDLEVPTSPPPKRVRRPSPKHRIDRTESAEPEDVDSQETLAESSKARSQPTKKPRGRTLLKEKSTNTKMSARHQKQLDDIVDRVRARPNPPKSLYILRRETPADDGVKLTRSGRMSFKPLAYWRNEQCVYGGSPSGGAGLRDGARFPSTVSRKSSEPKKSTSLYTRRSQRKEKARADRDAPNPKPPKLNPQTRNPTSKLSTPTPSPGRQKSGLSAATSLFGTLKNKRPSMKKKKSTLPTLHSPSRRPW